MVLVLHSHRFHIPLCSLSCLWPGSVTCRQWQLVLVDRMVKVIYLQPWIASPFNIDTRCSDISSDRLQWMQGELPGHVETWRSMKHNVSFNTDHVQSELDGIWIPEARFGKNDSFAIWYICHRLQPPSVFGSYTLHRWIRLPHSPILGRALLFILVETSWISILIFLGCYLLPILLRCSLLSFFIPGKLSVECIATSYSKFSIAVIPWWDWANILLYFH